MGYFSNGTQGGYFQERYCENCVHDRDEDCPIWMLHLMYNGTDDKNVETCLNALMPRKGTTNTCKMFHPTEQGEYSEKQERERMKAWANGQPRRA